jgi:hypothetical protein
MNAKKTTRILKIVESNGYKLIVCQNIKSKNSFFADYNLTTNELRVFSRGLSYESFKLTQFKSALLIIFGI